MTRVVVHTAFLTGQIRLRVSWLGRVVAQVEECHTTHAKYGGELIAEWHVWRDARREDVTFNNAA